MDDKASAASRLRRENTPGTPGEVSGDERFTVRTIEEKVRRVSSGPDYSTARSRKQRRKQERGSGLFLWLSVAVVVVVYLGLLASNVLKSRSARHRAVPAVSATPAAKPVSPAAGAQPDAPASEAPLDDVGVARPEESIVEVITGIKQAQRLADDGRRLVRNRNYLQAAEKFSEATKLAPNMFQTLLELAQTYWELNQLDACRDTLVRVVAINPDSSPARLLLARTFYDLGQSADALATAQWMLDADPYSEEANRISAEVYTSMHRYDLAINHWQRIAALSSGNSEVRNNLGAAQLQIGQIAQAINTFEGILKNEPANSQAHYYLAISFIRKNEPELAIDVLAKAKSRLGQQFVQAWTQGEEFDALRDEPSFIRLFPPNQVEMAIPPPEID